MRALPPVCQGSAVGVEAAGDVHAAHCAWHRRSLQPSQKPGSTGAAPASLAPHTRPVHARTGGPGPWTESCRDSWRPAGSGRQGGMRAGQARMRGQSGRVVVRDTERRDRREGEQEPVRAGEPEGSLGPGQRKEQGSQGTAVGPSA